MGLLSDSESENPEVPVGGVTLRVKRVFRRRSGGVSPVIGEVLIVSITVVAAVVVWLVVSRTVDQPDEEKIVVKFASPKVLAHERDNITVWDATLEIYTLTLRDETVRWTEVGVFVISDNGSIMQSLTNLTQDDPGAYDHTAPIDVEFWYVDLDPSEAKMTAGDGIKITGMDASWEGTTISMMHMGEIVGFIDLPTDFP
jgi:hypothetical protein